MSFCECGCGLETRIAPKNDTSKGWTRGKPLRFRRGHAARRHGHRPTGSRSPAYISWQAMIGRCSRVSNNRWKYYGGRGITVCDSWHDFANFLADMGERPEGTSLDRVDVNGNYEPGNCRWATATEQRANRRDKAAA